MLCYVMLELVMNLTLYSSQYRKEILPNKSAGLSFSLRNITAIMVLAKKQNMRRNATLLTLQIYGNNGMYPGLV